MRRDRPDVITELGNKELVFWFWLVLMINNSDSISPIRLSRGPGQLPGAWCCSVCSGGCSAEQHPGPRPESQVTPACSGWCVQCCSGPGVCSLHPLQSPATDCAAGGDEDRRPGGQNRREMINGSTCTLETLKHFNIDVWFCTLCSRRPLSSSPGLQAGGGMKTGNQEEEN